MANIKLPSALSLIYEIKRSLEKNQSLKTGVNQFFNCQSTDQFSSLFQTWWSLIGKEGAAFERTQVEKRFNLRQRALLQVIEKGLNGLRIYETLEALEKDFIECCEEDISIHTARLPLVLQAPLMGLIVPAILIILIIPALRLLQV